MTEGPIQHENHANHAGDTSGNWTPETVDLSPIAGKKITAVGFCTFTFPGGVNWTADYADFVLQTADGRTIPIYTGQTNYSITDVDGPGFTNHSTVPAPTIGNAVGQDPANSTYYYHGDQVNSVRLETGGGGGPIWSATYYPYGVEAFPVMGVNNYKFSGKERDAESGLDNFGARYFGSSVGRFLSPDPIGGSLLNPQTLNKYAYVINNPLTNTDPTGLYVCATGQDCTAFEKSLDALRGSKNANGVTVGFADLSKQGEDGKVTSSLGTDANGNLQAQSNVTINTGAKGLAFDAAIGHEGSHVADAQDVVKSIVVDPKTGDFTVGNNITRYQSEQRAYGVTNSILSSEAVNANEGCNGCDLGRNTMQGQVPGIVDRIMRTGNNYMSGGQHMGPKNQGGSVVNGVDQTPKAAVPH